LKIAFISLDFLPEQIGGGEVYTFNLAKAVQALGHEVVVIRRAHSKVTNGNGSSNYRGLRIERVFTERPARSAWANDQQLFQWGLEYFAKNRPDVVHVLLFAGMLPLVRAAKKLGIPVVMTALDFGMFCSNFHLVNSQGALCDGKMEAGKCEACQLAGYSSKHQTVYKATRHLPIPLLDSVRSAATGLSLKDPLLAIDVRRGLNALEENWSRVDSLVDALIAPSEVMKRMYALNGFPMGKVHLLPYGTNAAPATKAGYSPSNIRFGYIGRLHPSKGVDLLIEAFKKLEFTGVSLNLFGPTPSNGSVDPHFVRLSELAETDKRIDFRSAVTPERIGEAHREIDVLVVPSLWYENATITVLESLRYGTPVIASDVEGITEFVIDGVNGLTFPRKDVEGLNAAMTRIVKDPDLLNKLKAHTSTLPSMEENASKVIDIYRLVLELPAHVTATA
jgi:glycosyltransferase involved in cell wall biosynthesis